MHKIIVYGGNSQDKKQVVDLVKELSKQLKDRCGLFFFDGIAVDETAKPELFFLYSRNITSIHGKNVLLLQKKANLKKLKFLSSDTTVIVDSENQRQLEQIAKFHVNVITTGLSPKDTVTFSSKSEDSVVISLQRGISSLNGNFIEPMEIPCIVSGIGKDQLLLQTVTILLLSEMIDFEKESPLHF